MGHGHDHQLIPASASGSYLGRLVAALAIGAGFMVLELIVGFATSSLALISDAAHMVTDVLGISLAVTAILFARHSKPTPGRTFGLYRGEVLAALVNALLLFGVAGYVMIEAIGRIEDPPVISGLPVLIVATAGLAANLVSFFLLRAGAKESLNVRGAYLEVFADMIGSLGVLLSGVLTLTTGWRYADPIIGVAIGLFVLPRTYVLARRALRILFQHAPHGIDVSAISTELATLPGVSDVHDLHIWTLTSGMEVASAHLSIEEGAVPTEVLEAAQTLLANSHAIQHATLQIEPQGSPQHCHELSW